jgi:hypothetical protein
MSVPRVIGRLRRAVVRNRGHSPVHRHQLSPIPADFPKGTEAFYVMKYELRQREYARFVEALPTAWRGPRTPLELSGEGTDSCSIRLVDGVVVAQAPLRPCNFLSWDDTAAWTDWMALRP